MQSADSLQSVNSSVCDIPLGEWHYPWAVILEFHPGGRGKIVDGTITLSKSGIKVYLTIWDKTQVVIFFQLRTHNTSPIVQWLIKLTGITYDQIQ